MSQNLSPAAVVIGPLSVSIFNIDYDIESIPSDTLHIQKGFKWVIMFLNQLNELR